MPIKPGTLSDYSNSMAAEMEAELNAMLLLAGLPQLPTGNPERNDHRRLFVAIARGVVKHLKANQGSITVAYQADGLNKSTHVQFNAPGV